MEVLYQLSYPGIQRVAPRLRLRSTLARTVARDSGAVGQGCRERRCPFMRDAESEQRKAIASARSSAGVKVGRWASGLSSRMAGVSMALTTMMLAVARVPPRESASARVQASAAALAEA